jgi:carbon starvation protein
MFILAYYNTFKQLWQLFGSANQLLAALTMLAVSLWLMQRGKKFLFTLLPGIFMLITTIASLILILVKDYIPKQNYMLAAGDIVLLALAAGVTVLFIKRYRNRPRAGLQI